MSAGAYAFNDARFAYEAFSDEVIVLNKIDGTYFSFGGSATEAWSAIVSSCPLDAVCAALAARYSVMPEINEDLAEFVAQAVREHIFVEASAKEGAAELGEQANDIYKRFFFEKHADMQDLLTLDPIHDVDVDKGWPSR
jgi:Coenzyme PQQ synthesis protein D (PqqD)